MKDPKFCDMEQEARVEEVRPVGAAGERLGLSARVALPQERRDPHAARALRGDAREVRGGAQASAGQPRPTRRRTGDIPRKCSPMCRDAPQVCPRLLGNEECPHLRQHLLGGLDRLGALFGSGRRRHGAALLHRRSRADQVQPALERRAGRRCSRRTIRSPPPSSTARCRRWSIPRRRCTCWSSSWRSMTSNSRRASRW